ncbi:transcriptional regulator with XRE-family HTH domain [Desulfosalsimonas propionicica]|uniref:Transcriptional regulator with XRE-family HTH domain n=1 Tax=Desulfosalsimonas propionicica TaxID=332175 RepID=A0A7W0CBC0_9BACT|nr:helix-turn-helix transcriptional regulator [Desulfosalsimonas propionicica]MBA2882614.1 transcriptional regulator with XRE-family HTH domain [Desulfosalsimonas propionicica]
MAVFADELKRLRQAKQVSTAEAARAVGIPQSRYSELERGVRVAGEGQIERLEKYYEVDAGTLAALMQKQWDELMQAVAA